MGKDRDETAGSLSNLIKQPADRSSDDAIKAIDPPKGRFRPAEASASQGADVPSAGQSEDMPFEPRELALINAFLVYKGYSPAEPTEDPRGEESVALVAESDDPAAPAIVIGRGDGTFWFAMIDADADDQGPVSTGYDGIESLPLLLAMIEHPEEFEEP